jgi:hypothetical protein
MTFIPQLAHLVASANPIPDAPPVIRAVLPDLKTGEVDIAAVVKAFVLRKLWFGMGVKGNCEVVDQESF